MASVREMAVYSWLGMTFWQKAAVVGAAVLVSGALIFTTAKWIGTSVEVRRLEREANHARRDAEDALKKAADIAHEKLEAERKLAELEAKRDGKVNEAEKAHIETLDARAEYERALRERRGDNPSTEQLCTELRALGYPCS